MQIVRSLRQADPWNALSWAGVLLMVGMLVVSWQARHPALVLAMVIFLAASLWLQLRLRQLPSLLSFLLVLAALLSAAGGVFRWFELVGIYDEAVHTYTGFAGMAAIGYMYARERPRPLAFLMGWCAAMGLGLGIGWEVIEGLVGDLEAIDTATDLMFDTAGAALGGGFAGWALKRFPSGTARGNRRPVPSLTQQRCRL